MSGLELALVVTACLWLGILTIAVVLVVRQLSLMTVRLSHLAPHIVADDTGPDLGHSAPRAVLTHLNGRGEEVRVAFLSATCGTCRAVASALRPRDMDDLVVLIAGERSLAESVAELLPPGTEPQFDPVASEIATALRVDTVPFALRLDQGQVVGKAYLHTPADLDTLSRRSDEVTVVTTPRRNRASKEAMASE